MAKHYSRLYAAARALFSRPKRGIFYGDQGHSPDLKIADRPARAIVASQVLSYISAHKTPISFLDVGGRQGRDSAKDLAHGTEYVILDINPKAESGNTITGDICGCPQIPDASFDIVFSDNVLEHIKEPWLAAQEIGRILKPGGIVLTMTVFSWRYHPCPGDYWRYTHDALRLIFEKYGGLATIDVGYEISGRRSNFAGGKIENNRDGVPIDGYGAWLENWGVYHIGKKEAP